MMKAYWRKHDQFGRATLAVALICAAIVAFAIVASGITAAMFVNSSCAVQAGQTICTSSFDIISYRDIAGKIVLGFALIGTATGFIHGLSDQLRIARETGEARRNATSD